MYWKVVFYDFSTRAYHDHEFSGSIEEAVKWAQDALLRDPDLMLYEITPFG